jgi:hypothetical protein
MRPAACRPQGRPPPWLFSAPRPSGRQVPRPEPRQPRIRSSIPAANGRVGAHPLNRPGGPPDSCRSLTVEGSSPSRSTNQTTWCSSCEHGGQHKNGPADWPGHLHFRTDITAAGARRPQPTCPRRDRQPLRTARTDSLIPDFWVPDSREKAFPQVRHRTARDPDRDPPGTRLGPAGTRSTPASLPRTPDHREP